MSRELHHELFGSDDESISESNSPASAHAQSRDYDDGSRHRSVESRGTIASVGTTQVTRDVQQAPENKPWHLPERLLNSLSGDTSNLSLYSNIGYVKDSRPWRH